MLITIIEFQPIIKMNDIDADESHKNDVTIGYRWQ